MAVLESKSVVEPKTHTPDHAKRVRTYLYDDIFYPQLLESEPLLVSDEQKRAIKLVLDKCCSDSQFSAKAYAALVYLLTYDVGEAPTLTSLNPTSAALGSPSFTLSVKGSGFKDGDVIVWNGAVEPTTFVSETELTTGVDMSTAQVAMPIPVNVQTASGATTSVLTFNLTAPATQSIKSNTPEVKSPGFAQPKQTEEKKYNT